MKIRTTQKFDQSYAKAPLSIRKRFDQKLIFLLKNLHHPSLRAKKYDEAGDIWQARATKGWRFYFQIKDDIYHLIELTPHPE